MDNGTGERIQKQCHVYMGISYMRKTAFEVSGERLINSVGQLLSHLKNIMLDVCIISFTKLIFT